MNTDRKRKAPEQQSAIAKLRRARQATSQPSSREVSPQQQTRQTTKAPPAGNGVSKPKSQRTKLRAADPTLPQTVPESEETNPYTVLPYKQSWDGNRAYERVSDTQLRVELGQGTGCVILGRCTIWVKHGSVSVLGANLEAGPELWSLSAPNCAALPTIEARSSAAEIELACEKFVYDSPYHDREFFRPPPELRDQQIELPFFVLGLNFQSNPVIPRQLPILNMQDDHLRPLKTREGPAGILLCGPRSAGMAALARCLMNKAITASADGEPVIFLDLDPSLPVLGPVGTIAVSLASRPVLGQQSAKPEDSNVKVVRMHYLGPVDTVLHSSSWHQACIADVVAHTEELRRKRPKAALIVLAAETLRYDRPESARDFSRRLDLKTITTIERNGLSSTGLAIHSMADDLGISLKTVSSMDENQHTGRQHQLSLQAYFGRQMHASLGIDNLGLSYSGPDAQLLGLTLSDGHLPTSHLERALPGLLGAVVVISPRAVESVTASIRKCATSRLPILPSLNTLGLDPKELECHVLSVISKVDVELGTLAARVPLQVTNILPGLGVGEKLMLVVQPPSRDGKFTVLVTA